MANFALVVCFFAKLNCYHSSRGNMVWTRLIHSTAQTITLMINLYIAIHGVNGGLAAAVSVMYTIAWVTMTDNGQSRSRLYCYSKSHFRFIFGCSNGAEDPDLLLNPILFVFFSLNCLWTVKVTWQLLDAPPNIFWKGEKNGSLLDS